MSSNPIKKEKVEHAMIKKLKNIFHFLKEFADYLRIRKKWWLAPIVLILIILGIFIVLVEGSALAPFIYTLF